MTSTIGLSCSTFVWGRCGMPELLTMPLHLAQTCHLVSCICIGALCHLHIGLSESCFVHHIPAPWSICSAQMVHGGEFGLHVVILRFVQPCDHWYHCNNFNTSCLCAACCCSACYQRITCRSAGMPALSSCERQAIGGAQENCTQL